MTPEEVKTEYLARAAAFPESRLWLHLDNRQSRLYKLLENDRESLCMLYLMRKRAGIWQRPSPKVSTMRFLLAAIEMIDNVEP